MMEKSLNTCPRCKKNKVVNNKYGWCKLCKNEYNSEWRKKKLLEPGWREHMNKLQRGYVLRNKEKILLKQRESHSARRLLVLQHYGSACKCCGESKYEFLAIDHINGGGRKHYKEVGDLVHWIIRNKFPADFRVLCHNCNQALGFYGSCPHNNLV